MRISDRAIMALVRCWSFFRYNSVWRHTIAITRGWPDPVAPVSNVDKFMWRKLFDHNPLFTTACDKLAAKKYALSVCPGLKTAKVLWVGDDASAIPDKVLSGDVVIKANAGCGRNIMVHDGQVDRAAMRTKTALWMRRGYGVGKGEWGYRDANQCLFVEDMLLDNDQPVRFEYKLHVYSGRIVYIFVTRGSGTDDRIGFQLDGDGVVHVAPLDDEGVPIPFIPPAIFDRMRDSAQALAAPFDYMRCDFYEVDGEIYFSELTAYPMSGLGAGNSHLGKLRNAAWDLRKSWLLTSPQSGWRRMYADALRRWLDTRAMPLS
jgi:hypothetical protein